jgi:AbiV family abortive infection protein
MNKKEYREIPRAKIQEGIDLCKMNIFVFLNTAKGLLKADNLNHAAINAEFAIEEFAKILMLKDEYEKGSDPVQVPNNIFTDHKKKSKRAWKSDDPYALNPKYKMVSNGGFERSDNGKQGFTRGFSQVINISHYIRCECAFVDYDENDDRWYVGHEEIVKERLQNLIEHVREKTTSVALFS